MRGGKYLEGEGGREEIIRQHLRGMEEFQLYNSMPSPPHNTCSILSSCF